MGAASRADATGEFEKRADCVAMLFVRVTWPNTPPGCGRPCPDIPPDGIEGDATMSTPEVPTIEGYGNGRRLTSPGPHVSNCPAVPTCRVCRRPSVTDRPRSNAGPTRTAASEASDDDAATRIMRKFTISELSAVDRPAQVHARSVLLKRADDKEPENENRPRRCIIQFCRRRSRGGRGHPAARERMSRLAKRRPEFRVGLQRCGRSNSPSAPPKPARHVP